MTLVLVHPVLRLIPWPDKRGKSVYRGGKSGESDLLANCYANSLKIAAERGLRTIAFPSISTGVYGYPVEKAAQEAVRAVRSFVASHPDAFDEIVFCGFDASTEAEYTKALLKSV